MLYAYIIWGGNDILLALILARAFTNDMVRRYTVFYSYVMFTLVVSVSKIPIVVFYGMQSRQYYYAYNLTNAIIPLFQLWILWDIYRRIIGNDKISSKELSRSATLVALVTAP